MLGRDFQKLVRIHIFDCLFQRHDSGGNKTKRLIGRRGTRIGQMFGLADIDFNIFGLGGLADNHAGVNFFACADKQDTAFLRVIQSVGNGSAGLEGNQGAGLSVRDIALVRLVIDFCGRAPE